MRLETYNAIVDFLSTHQKQLTSEPSYPKFSQLKAKFPHVPDLSLRSIYSSTRQRQMKTKYHEFNSPYKGHKYWDSYQSLLPASPHKHGVLQELAAKVDLPPSLLARIIVQSYTQTLPSSEGSRLAPSPTYSPTDYMRCPHLIPDEYLAEEVWRCVLADDVYGPITDAVKHCSGQEYEERLKAMLEERKVPYVDESQLRAEGYDKTPDIKLTPPLLFFPTPPAPVLINWIESKALFGDSENHEHYFEEQYSRYCNRFGTGLVIYWFGFVDTLLHKDVDKGVHVVDRFPQQLQTMVEYYTSKSSKE